MSYTSNEAALTLKAFTPNNNVIFDLGTGTEVLKLDKDGFVYKGERINDAGEAHRLFIQVMQGQPIAPATITREDSK